MSKTCDNCGCKVYSHGCVNCDESEYISMQEGYAELYPEPEQQPNISKQDQNLEISSESEREKLIDKLKDIHAANGNVFDIADFILEREKEKDAEIERLNQEVESLTVTVKTLNKELTSWHGKAKELEAENERLKGEREEDAGSLPNEIQLFELKKLLMFSDRYEISIQFWPQQIAVYIEKDGVDLTGFGGDFDYAIGKSIEYLNRITGGNI